MEPPLILILGPTAVGKSSLALAVAALQGGAILSADAMQVYRGFDKGTAKPTAAEREQVPHFLIDIADPRQDFSAGDYVRAAEAALQEVRVRGLRPVLVGGTGLYVRAFLRGLFPGPYRDRALRRRLESSVRRHGREHLHRMLTRVDPASAARLAPADTQRIVRALEVRFATGKTLSAHHLADGGGVWSGRDRFGVVKIGLRMERGRLWQRIEQRVRRFFANGLVAEVRELLAAGVPADANAFKGIGYRQCLQVARGELSEEEARERTVLATRRYAKRQMTWFQRERDVRWIDAGQDRGRILHEVKSLVR